MYVVLIVEFIVTGNFKHGYYICHRRFLHISGNSVLMLISGEVQTSAKDPRSLGNAFRPRPIMPA